VTVLTSFDAATLREIGMAGSMEKRAVALARLAKKTGMDGVVCSAHEARAIRRACGPKFVILIPGVRPRSGAANDQSRIATPGEAIRAGADYLVVGRPITAAPDPRSAVLAIVNEMKSASREIR
jgi:orotidine-5'-phosphate decarboxylase